ncbi:endoribonuclease Dicer, partial [Phenoliferia sp. Uapishka_3]
MESPRNYQLEAMEAAKDQSVPFTAPSRAYMLTEISSGNSNTILRMDTGTGKTLVAIMLIRHITSTPVPSGEPRKLVVFLAPTADLVRQQAKKIEGQTRLRVKSFIGDDSRRSVTDPTAEPLKLKLSFWEREVWEEEFERADVVVCTPQIWLDCLNHRYWEIGRVSLLVFDESHHADKNHPYNAIMQLHYHPAKMKGDIALPRVLGLTASPVTKAEGVLKSIHKLEANLDATLFEIKQNQAEVLSAAPRPTQQLVEYEEAVDFGETTFEMKLRAVPDLGWDEKTWRRVEVTRKDLGSLACDMLLSLLLTADLHASQPQFGHVLTPRNPVLSSLLIALKSHIENEPLTTANSSPHFFALVDILITYRSRPNFHAIIFAQQRNHARVLVDMLHKVEKLREWVRADWLVGHGGKEEEVRGQGMDSKEQEAKVERFRTGATNVLVATSVAEEGLDFPTCSVVIRFDGIRTITSFIQSRGRARADDSSLFVLAVRDSLDAANYYKFDSKEPDLTTLYGEHESSPHSADDNTDFSLTTFRAESGALLSHHEAISLLAQVCALLPEDPYVPHQKPRYTIEGSGTSWMATVSLPMIVGITNRKISGESMRNKGAAKQSAAFQICLDLARLGHLDDHLLPKRVSMKDGRDADGGKVDYTKVPEFIVVKTPNVFGNIGNPESPLFLYTVEVFDGSETLEFGLVTSMPHAEFVRDKLFHPDGRREMTVTFGNRQGLIFEPQRRAEALTLLDNFNREVFRLLLNRRLKDEPLDVLWVPLREGRAGIDWNAVSNVWGPVPPEGVPSGTSIYVPHRRIVTPVLEFVKVRDDVDTLSPACDVDLEPSPKDVKTLSKSPTYAIYASRIYDYKASTTIPDTIYQLRTLPNIIPNLMAHPSACLDAPAPHKSRLANFPSMICRTSPLPPSFFDLIRMTPSLTRLLHDAVQTKALMDEFELPPIPIPLMIQALTAPSCSVGYDYQLLETVGDSVLKLLTTIHVYLTNPTYDEGRMAALRQNSIDNQYLKMRSLLSGYAKGILNETFRTKTWIPTTSNQMSLVEGGAFVQREVSAKALPDTMEATLGAAYVARGISMALETGHQLGLCFGGTKPWGQRESPPQDLAIDTSAPAILEYWATDRIFKFPRFQHSSPRALTFARARLVNNTTLAVIGTRILSLHQSILHGSADLERAIARSLEDLERTIQLAQKDAPESDFATELMTGDLIWTWDPPKTLGDVVESILGSIFIDCGLVLDVVLGVLDEIFKPFMPLLTAVSESKQRDPFSNFTMFVQKHGCQCIKIKVVMSLDPKSTSPTAVATSTFQQMTIATFKSSSRSVVKQLAARETLRFLHSVEGEQLLETKTCTCANEGNAVEIGDVEEVDPELLDDMEEDENLIISDIQ